MSIALADLVNNHVDPENDRRPEAYRVRRYVAEAVNLAHRLQLFRHPETGRPLRKQEIADMALAAYLPDEVLDAAYEQLYGRQRPAT